MLPTDRALLSWIQSSCACLIALINLVHSQHTVCVARGSNASVHSYRVITLRHPKESLIISSPNFPQNYAKNIQCTWRIEAPNRCAIRLSYLAFDLGEPHLSGCHEDFLTVSEDGRALMEGHRLRKECGNTKPPDIRSKSRVVWIRFTSDSKTERTGFSLDIRPVCASSKARRYSILGAIFLGMLVIIVAVIICRRRPKSRTVQTHTQPEPTLSKQGGSSCQEAPTPTNVLRAVMPSASSQTTQTFSQLDQEICSSIDKESPADPLPSSLSPISLAERQGLARGDQQHAAEQQVLEILV